MPDGTSCACYKHFHFFLPRWIDLFNIFVINKHCDQAIQAVNTSVVGRYSICQEGGSLSIEQSAHVGWLYIHFRWHCSCYGVAVVCHKEIISYRQISQNFCQEHADDRHIPGLCFLWHSKEWDCLT